jgi:hypothetical protein
MDEFTRECLALEVERRMTARDVVVILTWLEAKRGAPGTGGDVAAGTVDYFTGAGNGPNGVVDGGGVTVGVGGGGAASVTRTTTKVDPIFGRKTACP